MQEILSFIEEFTKTIWADAVVWFIGLGVILKFVRNLSKNADEELNPEKRKLLGKKLLNLDKQDIESWIPDFLYIFDDFFGHKHLSLKCFLKSTMISIFSFFFLYLAIGDVDLDDWVFSITFVLTIALLLNVPIDYLSLLQTRLLLAAQKPPYLIIIIDFLITSVISVLWASLIIYILFNLLSLTSSGELGFGYIETLQFILESVSGVSSDFIAVTTEMRVSLITTFITSVWLWLYGISQLITRSSTRLLNIRDWLNVEEAPMRSLGIIVNGFILFLGIIWFVFNVILGGLESV